MEKYGLGVMLFSFLNDEEYGSSYYTIAKYILENMDSIKNCSVNELAKQCNVSMATISRFCRKAGYDNFFDLKVSIHNNYLTSTPQYEYKKIDPNEESSYKSYLDSVVQHISVLKNSLQYDQIDKLVEDIHNYKNICALGFMHMENTARSLQSDLFRCRKIIDVRAGVQRQREYFNSINEENLIIIFSHSGNYIKEIDLETLTWSMEHKPKVYVITANAAIKNHNNVDELILLPKEEHDFASHPHCMNLICSMICLEYYNRYIKE